MPRLARHLFTSLSAVSLVLFFAFCTLWVRSYRAMDTLMLTPLARGYEGSIISVAAASNDGYIIVQWTGRRSSNAQWMIVLQEPNEMEFEAIHWWEKLGFAFRPRRALPGSANILIVPDIAFAIAFAALPGFWLLARLRSRRRKRDGRCAHCGYNLRASPERCPECGREANARRGGGDEKL